MLQVSGRVRRVSPNREVSAGSGMTANEPESPAGRSKRGEGLWQVPGRLWEMQSIGIIQDLLQLYASEQAFVDELRLIYSQNRHLLSLARCLASAYDRDFGQWYEARVATHWPVLEFGLGRFPNIESWTSFNLLASRSERAPAFLTTYIRAVETVATRWFVAAPWGAELVHASLVTWRSVPAWRGTRLSVGGGEGPGFPSMWLDVKVQFEPGAHAWGDVKAWVLRDAKKQFDEIMAQLRAREQRIGRSEFIARPRSRRRLAEGESTYERDLRWLFMTLAPDAMLNRPLTPREIFDRDAGTERLSLTAVEKALSNMRRRLD